MHIVGQNSHFLIIQAIGVDVLKVGLEPGLLHKAIYISFCILVFSQFHGVTPGVCHEGEYEVQQTALETVTTIGTNDLYYALEIKMITYQFHEIK